MVFFSIEFSSNSDIHICIFTRLGGAQVALHIDVYLSISRQDETIFMAHLIEYCIDINICIYPPHCILHGAISVKLQRNVTWQKTFLGLKCLSMLANFSNYFSEYV